MAIGSAPYYWLICDRCGVTSTEDQEITAWSDIYGAEGDAEDWVDEGGYHLCPDCDDEMVMAMEDLNDPIGRRFLT